MNIKFEIDDEELQAALGRLIEAGTDLQPAYQDIGEALTETTKQRFQTATGPDGTAWHPNSQLTLLKFLNKSKGNFNKDGRLSSRGAGRVTSKKPLTGESKSLRTQINYRLLSDGVEIGSPMKYAAVQQFGAKQGAFGRTRRGGPIPWGDIPARPFLGVSDADERSIREIFNEHLASALEG